MIYVSLYGIQDAEEITKAIYAAMHPILGGKIGELGKVVFKGLLKSTLKIDLHHLENGKADLSAVLGIPDNTGNKDRIFRNRILVFDDVERAKMPVSDILALVQPLVESHEDRVILVANEKDIAADDEKEKDFYKRIKEKTVYLTLYVNPHIKNAWENALEHKTQNTFKRFLCDQEHEFVRFIEKTNTENLRIRDFFMIFGEEIFLYITKKYNAQDKNRNIMNILYTVYGVLIEKNIYKRNYTEVYELLDFQFKSQLVTTNRNTESYTKNKTAFPIISQKPYFKVFKKYKNIIQTIYTMIETGHLNEEYKKEILESVREANIPSWKKILLFPYEKTTNEHYDKIIKSFEEDFANKKPHDDNELLHICDVYLMLNKLGVRNFTRDDPIKILKAYIEEYYKTCTFVENNELDKDERDIQEMELYYYGSMYNNFNDDFLEIINYFNKIRTNYMNENILHYFIKQDKVIELIRLFSSGSEKYIHKNPILHLSNPADFLKSLDQRKGTIQQKILLCLSLRLQKVKQPSSTLAPEKTWFEELTTCLKKETSNSTNHPLRKEMFHLHIKILEEPGFLLSGKKANFPLEGWENDD